MPFAFFFFDMILTFYGVVLFIFEVYFLLRERERKRGRGREGGREGIPSRLCTASTEPDAGLESTSHELKSEDQPIEPRRRPFLGLFKTMTF